MYGLGDVVVRHPRGRSRPRRDGARGPASTRPRRARRGRGGVHTPSRRHSAASRSLLGVEPAQRSDRSRSPRCRRRTGSPSRRAGRRSGRRCGPPSWCGPATLRWMPDGLALAAATTARPSARGPHGRGTGGRGAPASGGAARRSARPRRRRRRPADRRLGGGSCGTLIRTVVARSRRDLGLLALKLAELTCVTGSTGVGTSTSVSRRTCLSSVSTVGEAASPLPPRLPAGRRPRSRRGGRRGS